MNFDINTVVSKGLCTGCGLCAGLTNQDTVVMRMNASGFLRPVQLQPLALSIQGVLARSCPGVVVEHDDAERSVAHDVLWGPVLSSYTSYASASDFRWRGSSGGAISALLWHLLATKEVDGVAHIAVDPERPLENMVVISRTQEDVLRSAGSRYSPAAPLSNLGLLLESQQRLAFVGKPCDVAALRQLIRVRPELQERFPYLLSFMCAGTPSLNATSELLKRMGASDEEQIISFRYRGDGWPGTAKATLRDGRTYETDYNSSWGEVLGRRLQFRCKICPDGTGELADITCGDAWYSDDGYPTFEEKEGRSLVLIRTERGNKLFAEALAAGALIAEALPLDDVQLMQPYQVTRKRLVLARLLGAALRLRVMPRFRRLRLWRVWRQASLLDCLRQAWGTFRRAESEKQ